MAVVNAAGGNKNSAFYDNTAYLWSSTLLPSEPGPVFRNTSANSLESFFIDISSLLSLISAGATISTATCTMSYSTPAFTFTWSSPIVIQASSIVLSNSFPSIPSVGASTALSSGLGGTNTTSATFLAPSHTGNTVALNCATAIQYCVDHPSRQTLMFTGTTQTNITHSTQPAIMAVNFTVNFTTQPDDPHTISTNSPQQTRNFEVTFTRNTADSVEFRSPSGSGGYTNVALPGTNPGSIVVPVDSPTIGNHTIGIRIKEGTSFSNEVVVPGGVSIIAPTPSVTPAGKGTTSEEVTSSYKSIYKVPTGKSGLLQRIIIVTAAGTAPTFTAYVMPNGVTTPAIEHTIFSGKVVAASGTQIFKMHTVIPESSELWVISNEDGVMAVHADFIEF